MAPTGSVQSCGKQHTVSEGQRALQGLAQLGDSRVRGRPKLHFRKGRSIGVVEEQRPTTRLVP